jgi:hypothetical protein
MIAIKKPLLLEQFKVKKTIIVRFEDRHLLIKENRNFAEKVTTTSGTIPTISNSI